MTETLANQWGQGKVERQEQGKINVRLKQNNHNHKRNYNLMGFDNIEINLVVIIRLIRDISLISPHIQNLNLAEL